MSNFSRWCPAVLTVLIVSSLAAAQDWPQWRGPNRNGIAAPSKPIPASMPAEAPKKLWTSEKIPGGGDGGYGSVVVANGNAYVYVNFGTPVKWRQLPKYVLTTQGYSDKPMPEALAQAVEQARTGDARKAIKDDKGLADWISQYVQDNIKPEQSAFAPAVRERLRAGPAAWEMSTLTKLAPLAEKKFDTEQAAQTELKNLGLDDAMVKQVLGRMVPPDRDMQDSIYCLDAATGATKWKTPMGGDWFYFACSSTPAIVDGKCYVWNSEGIVYCLDAAKGDILWKSEAVGGKAFHHNRSSSPMVIDGVVIVPADAGNGGKGLVGLDAANGKLLWKNEALANQQASAASWNCGGKTFAIVNAGKLYAIDPKDGKIAWQVPAGGAGTPSVVGDIVAVCAGDTTGVLCYRMSADKAEKLWTAANKDTHSAPLICGDYVYVVGGAYQDPGKGKAQCVSMKDGKVVWEEILGPAQLSSPLLVGDTIIAYSGQDLVMFKASPEKFIKVGKWPLGMEHWTSPCYANGNLLVRTSTNIVCYEIVP